MKNNRYVTALTWTIVYAAIFEAMRRVFSYPFEIEMLAVPLMAGAATFIFWRQSE